jgi:hypothetical protein
LGEVVIQVTALLPEKVIAVQDDRRLYDETVVTLKDEAIS